MTGKVTVVCILLAALCCQAHAQYIQKDSSLVLMQDFYTNSTSSYNSNFVFIEPYARSWSGVVFQEQAGACVDVD